MTKADREDTILLGCIALVVWAAAMWLASLLDPMGAFMEFMRLH